LVEQSRNRQRGKQPVSRHPLFTPIVGLWGAVLFGLAGLAFTPSAAPALVLTVLGALVGLIFGRLVARPKSTTTADEGPVASRDAASSRIPGQPADLWNELQTRRQALSDRADEAAADPEPLPAPAPPFLDRAPQILDVAAVKLEPSDATVIDHEPAEPEPAIDGGHEWTPEPAGEAEPTAADRIATGDLADLSHVELLERLALSLQRRGRAAPAAAPVANALAMPESAGVPQELEQAIVFPARAERQTTVTAPPVAASGKAETTEETLRAALAALHRMSGAA